MPEANVHQAARPARLLLIDGSAALAERLAAPIAAEFVEPPDVVELLAGRPALELLKASSFDGLLANVAALADIADAVEERIARLVRAASGALIVVLADDASISVALSAMRAGAHDCVDAALDGAGLVARLGELASRHGKAQICLRSSIPRAQPEPPAASIPVMRDLVLPMWRQEQRIIETAIQSFAGNIALAAAALELSPSTIYRKRQAWSETEGKQA